MRKNYLFLFAISLVMSLYIPQQIQAQRKKKDKQQNSETYDPSELFSAQEYRLVGPFRGGRSAAVTGVANKDNLYYFGATGGGVWKTTDGGRSWGNISDGFFGGSIGSIAVAASDPNVIYVGGGEKTVRGNVSSGYGMWKSEDAGQTWTATGLEKSRHISRIAVHPNNSELVYAAVMGNIYKEADERGVYKSTDGGKSWRKVLFANAMAGAVDLVLDPNNPRIIYASTWRVQRTPYSLSSGGEGSALWKSEDGGENWKEISQHEGFAEGTLGIIGVAVSPVNSNRVWAMVENQKEGGLYRSEDGGKTWKKVNSERKLRQRAWYYTRLYADTADENIVYVLNVRYHRSTDGGKSFTTHVAPHGDHHDLWIDPNNSKRMIIGDDGGAQVSNDAGETWTTYHNQPTSQFYRVTTDDHFPFRIYAAQQDNSTIRIAHRSDESHIGNRDWEPTAGGESAHIAVDPTDNEIVYGGSYGGFLSRVNHRTKTTRAVNVWPDNPMGYGAEGMKYRFQWNFPIFFSKHNPKKLYTFSNHVHMSEDEGQSWKLLSGDLTRNDSTRLVSSGGPITQDNTGVEYYCTIFAANESPLKEGLLWVGTDDGLVHVSENGGESWSNVSPGGMPEWMMINSIEPSHHEEGTCYVAGTRYKLGDFQPYLYKTKDYGKTWTKITSGIGSEHFTRVLREDPVDPNILYAGTETGMYISYDRGSNWKKFQLNLPIVPITDLVIKNNSLVVATQGRSLWMLDDLTLIHQAAQLKKGKEALLFAPKTAYRMKGSKGKASKLEGTNMDNGVVTYYWLPEFDQKKDSLWLRYFSPKGDTLATLTNFDGDKKKLKVDKGSNKAVWDMRTKGAEKLEGMILWWANLQGAKAVPGSFEVELEYKGQKQRQSFEILPDPRAEVSVAQMQEQFDFVSSVNETVDQAHQAIKDIRKINAQLEDFIAQYESDQAAADLIDEAKSLKEGLSEVEKALYQTKNRSNQDPLNFPIKLTNKLGHLNSLVTMDDFPPTEQDVKVKEELTAAIMVELEKFDQMLDEKVSAFNKAFNESNLNYLFVK